MNFFQSLSAALTPAGLLWTVIIIGVATFLHELAHYALARWQGVKVNSFSVGMGPVLFRREWRGTQWRLSLLPIGGYVEIDGMAPEASEDGQTQPPTGGFTALPAWGKIAIMLAGPLMNLLLAIFLMTGMFTSQGIPETATDQAKIARVRADSKAAQLGLKDNDIIVGIDGKDIPDSFQADGKILEGWQLVQQTLKTAGTHSFAVLRGTERLNFSFDWQAQVNGKRQLLGIEYGPNVIHRPATLGTAFRQSWQVTAEAVPQVIRSFAGLFKRFLTLDLTRDQNVSGPIGTAEIVSQAAALSPWALVQVAILLNLSLAFFNLLPIPGLDGGRILLVLIGTLRGRPLTFAQEQAINLAGFAFVMMLTVFVVVRDLSRFF